jgi:hypothetical protein
MTPFRKAFFTSLRCCKCQKNPNGLNTSNRSKGFPKVLTFYLVISMCYKASLFSHNLVVLPLFVLEHPFGANRIDSMRRINQGSDLASLKVLQLFMHGIDPTRIRKSVSNISRLEQSNKRSVDKA